MESQGGVTEGSRGWLGDASVSFIEDVVKRRLPELSYSKKWDTRPVRYGANQGPRDHSVGDLVVVPPEACFSGIAREVFSIRFVSGRVVDAGSGQLWVTQ